MIDLLKSWKNALFCSVAAGCLVWGFMILQFWWGNHDWRYLQYGVAVSDGLFEARYSQHLFTAFLFNGQVLPIFTCIISLFALSFMGCLAAIYLGFSADKKSSILFLCLLLSLPYTAIVFYYLFIALPLTFYAAFGVGILFFAQSPFRWWKFICGFTGVVLLLGSYPPILALVVTIFVGQKLICYIKQKMELKDIFKACLFLGGQFLLAYAVTRGIWKYLTDQGVLNTQMYNLQMRHFNELPEQILKELVAPLKNIGFFYQTLGIQYAMFYAGILGTAVFKMFYLSKNKMIVLLGIGGLFLASRLSFLLSASAYLAEFRVAYWGQLGILIVAMCFLFDTERQWQRNLLFASGFFFLFLFVRTDYDIQKVQYLKFRAERLYHTRLLERIFFHPNFDVTRSYVSLSVGYPNFKEHICGERCSQFDNEVLSYTVMPADLISALFWDDMHNPVSDSRMGVWGKRLWFVGAFVLKPEDIATKVRDIRWWMYREAEAYPSLNSLYIDDAYLIMNLDELFFNQSKEIISKGLLTQ
ncbi:MAG: glucosyltransferase domain-containing protein [Acetobacter sp.]|nr:glucosyltransferase domain-containing protein [Acetobacter sp.]